MTLATQTDVEAALGRACTPEEAARLDHLLGEASDLVAGYLRCGNGLQLPYPDPVVRATASMVVAVLNRPAALPADADQVNAGIYGVHFVSGSTSNGPWLTASLRERLDPYRCGASSMASMGTATERFIP